VSDLDGKVALVSGAAAAWALRSRSGRAERAITEHPVFGRQALAASLPGGEVVD
jgi:hypothetical protein